jgi:hypothetical protein
MNRASGYYQQYVCGPEGWKMMQSPIYLKGDWGLDHLPTPLGIASSGFGRRKLCSGSAADKETRAEEVEGGRTTREPAAQARCNKVLEEQGRGCHALGGDEHEKDRKKPCKGSFSTLAMAGEMERSRGLRGKHALPNTLEPQRQSTAHTHKHMHTHTHTHTHIHEYIYTQRQTDTHTHTQELKCTAVHRCDNI